MGLFESLKEYFDNASPEQLKKDWEKLKEWENVGPTVDEYINSLKEAGIYKEHEHNKD